MFSVFPELDPEVVSALRERSILCYFFDTSEGIIRWLNDAPGIEVHLGDGKHAIAHEGDRPAELWIVLAGELLLHSKGPSGTSEISGVVSSCRSLNLYSVLRGKPYQYSAIPTHQAQVLRIPLQVLKALLDGRKNALPYLLGITENPVIRQLAKDLEEIGCSKAFRLELLGSIQEEQLTPQSWIVHQKEAVKFTFLVASGAIHAYCKDKKSGKLNPLWQVPFRSWQLWKEGFSGALAPYSFRSLSGTSIWKISRASLQSIDESLPDDFAKYSAWVLKTTAAKANDEEGEDQEEIESLSHLFAGLPGVGRKSPSKYPFVPQNDQMDCGPACLAMVSKWFGNEVSIQYWRSQVQTDREGTSLFDLAKACERNGFVCHAVGLEDIRTVESDLLPIIILRRYHYMVVYHVADKFVVVGDPSLGIRNIPLEEFEEGYERVALLMKPTESFYSIRSPSTPYRHYLELFTGFRKEILLVGVSSAMMVVLAIFPPLLMQIIIDEVLGKKDDNLLVALLGGAVCITFSQALMGYVRSYYLGWLSAKFDFRAGSAFFRKVFTLPYAYFASRHVGDFTRRLSEMERLRKFVTDTLVGTLLDLITLFFYAIVLVLYSPTVALATMLTAPLLLAVSMLFSKRLVNSYLAAFNARAHEESYITDMLKGMALIKSMSAEVAARWRYEEAAVTTLKARYESQKTSNLLGAIIQVIDQSGRFLLMGLGAHLAIKGKMSPGQVLSLSLLVNNVFGPFHGLASSWSSLQELKAVIGRLNDVFLAPSETMRSRTPGAGIRKRKLRGEIEFQNVWFRYGGDSSNWVLRDVSFKIEAGQNVAVVGPSGSGKSTIANLITRLHEPTQGQILIDGRDYREYDVQWLRSQIGIILQETCLFHGSVMENIGFGHPVVNVQKAVESAKLAEAHDFIQKKASGYDYFLTHGGLGLSGGEKQRIALARMLYAAPSILMLDEATAALDGITERALLQSLRSAANGRTILSIAHRYTTVRMSDFALVMRDGKVLGFGTHDQLAQTPGLYSELFGLGSDDQEDAAA